MRKLNTNLETHLVNASTTLCHAWRLTRTDGVVLGFTDHDEKLEFDGTEFLPESGFIPSAVRSELGLNVDDGEVAGAFSSNAILEKDISDGRYDGARIEVFFLNWQEPQNFLKLRTQELGEVSYSDQVFQAELRSIAHKLDQAKGRTFSKKCAADLGDNSCKVNLDAPQYKSSGTLISSTSDRQAVVSGLSNFDNGWFRYGLLQWTTGQNQGLSVEVQEHALENGSVTLSFFSPLPNVPGIGDQFTVTAGCSKSFGTCGSKFSNVLNFQGFPHLPGSDFAYGYADTETVHDGRPLVT